MSSPRPQSSSYVRYLNTHVGGGIELTAPITPTAPAPHTSSSSYVRYLSPDSGRNSVDNDVGGVDGAVDNDIGDYGVFSDRVTDPDRHNGLSRLEFAPPYPSGGLENANDDIEDDDDRIVNDNGDIDSMVVMHPTVVRSISIDMPNTHVGGGIEPTASIAPTAPAPVPARATPVSPGGSLSGKRRLKGVCSVGEARPIDEWRAIALVGNEIWSCDRQSMLRVFNPLTSRLVFEA